jgi:Fe-S oxidoreductase
MERKYEFERKYRDQILRCSSCGFCQAVCPVYGSTIRPSYNARGKMLILKEVMDGRIELNEELIETLCQCTTCASCSTQCPSGVEVPEIIKQVRKDLVDIGSCHPAFKGMHAVLEKHADIYAEDDLPDFGRARKAKAENVFFAGCVGAYREEEATHAVLDVLDRLKVDYTLVEEICCGGVLEDVGYALDARRAETNVGRILATGARRLITACPYCARTFNSKAPYAGLRAKGVEVLHISQFLKDFDLGVRTDLRVAYHDPCDLGRHCGIYEEPREVIRRIAGNFVELEHHHAEALCCGAGGGLRGAFPKNSLAMARRRLAEAEAAGVDVVLTECNSCVHNLANAKLRKQKFKVSTTLQFVRQLWNETGTK